MKPLVAIAVLCCLAGCSRKTEAAKESPAAAKEEKPANTAVLSEEGQRSAGVVVEPVTERSLPEVVRATARIGNNENQTWRVGAITDGRVVKAFANVGDTVKTGQVLARIHSHEIHEAQSTYQKAVAELSRANNSLAYAVRARDRARRLYDLKAGSMQEWEHAETEVKNAQAAVTTAQSDVDRARIHITEFLGLRLDTRHGDARDDDDEYIPVRSPANGVVLTRGVTPGTVVTPSSDMYVISDLSTLWAIAEVNEEHLGRLRPGMQARVYVQAYGREAFAGRIGKLGEAFDPTTRTVKVRIDVPNRGGKLKPEMYANAEIEIGGSKPSVFVPQEAAQEVRGETVVFVRTAADRFEVRPVQLGRPLDGSVEVTRGVRPGERVATKGAFILKTEFLKASLSEE
jgi:multidrug efflux pump subunit AcrA (membrane-fusion protein)